MTSRKESPPSRGVAASLWRPAMLGLVVCAICVGGSGAAHGQGPSEQTGGGSPPKGAIDLAAVVSAADGRIYDTFGLLDACGRTGYDACTRNAGARLVAVITSASAMVRAHAAVTAPGGCSRRAGTAYLAALAQMRQGAVALENGSRATAKRILGIGADAELKSGKAVIACIKTR